MRLSAVKRVALAGVIAIAAGSAMADSSTSYKIVDGGIPESLTGKPGDPDAGRAAMINQRLGNCLACHQSTALKDQPFHGEIGPALDGVADRYSEAQIRLIVVNAKEMFDGTMMPAFYKSDGLTRVMDSFSGKSILSAADVENVVAYLKTFKE